MAGAVFLGEGLSGSLFRGIIEVWFCHNEGIRQWIPAEVITHRQGRVKRNRKTLLTTLCEGDILNLIKLRKADKNHAKSFIPYACIYIVTYFSGLRNQRSVYAVAHSFCKK